MALSWVEERLDDVVPEQLAALDANASPIRPPRGQVERSSRSKLDELLLRRLSSPVYSFEKIGEYDHELLWRASVSCTY